MPLNPWAMNEENQVLGAHRVHHCLGDQDLDINYNYLF